MDRPRTARPDDLPAITDLVEHVFRESAGRPRGVTDLFPRFLSPENAENLFVVAEGGRVVGFLGADLQTYRVGPCRIPCALLGAVCVHESHRGRGHAGRLLELALGRLADRGAALVWISGHRSVYRAFGAEPVWPLRRATVRREALGARADPTLRIEPVTAANLADLVALHDREPFGFEWTPEWIECVPLHLLDGRHGAGFLLRCIGVPVGAACFRSPAPETGQVELFDWYGSRQAVVAAADTMLSRLQAEGLTCRFVAHDATMTDALAAVGAEVEPIGPRGWTLKVLDFPRLLACLGPRLERMLDDRDGSITAVDGGIRTRAGDAEWVSPDERAATRAVFAPPDQWGNLAAGMPPAVRELLARAFPVPLRHYGLNYI